VPGKNQEKKTEALAVKNDRLAFTFVPSDAGNFVVIFPPGSLLNSSEELLKQITEEYGKVLQAKLIQRIERSAAASGFRLGSRAVNQDRSVTLTLGLS
jgi:predicted RNA-binding protein with PIN domain